MPLKKLSVYLDDETLQKVKERAVKKRLKLSALVKSLLEGWLRRGK